VNRRGIPVAALAVSGSITALCVVINYIIPEKAFGFLMMLVVTALVINWLMISVTHLKFIKVMKQQHRLTAFKAIASPWTNYLTIAFMFFILTIMSLTPDMRSAVILAPVWLSALAIMYFVYYRKRNVVLTGGIQPNP